MPLHAGPFASRPVSRSAVLILTLVVIAAICLATAAPRLAAGAQADRVAIAPAAPVGFAVAGHEEFRGDSGLEAQMRGLPAGGSEAILARFRANPAQSKPEITGHDLGWLVFAETRDLSEAYGRCDASRDGGCYHGVLQLYFAEAPRIAASEIASFCNGGKIDVAATTLGQYHCLHGLGHGLAIFSRYQLSPPLASCDLLASEADREMCYSGVFMEMTTEGRVRASSLGAGDAFFDLDAFPRCFTLAARYQPSCYVLHPLSLLIDNGGDVRATSIACQQAPAAFITDCFKGLGMAITGIAGLDPSIASELCERGDGPYRLWCWSGAIESFLGSPRTVDRASALCRHAPTELQTFCFESLGETLLVAGVVPVDREVACARAEKDAWVAACRAQAGLQTWDQS